ncbi:hypothetical protein PAXINDRAFT_14807 [Paxillus involutus ATCC 200175]|uniref:Uncharacterized protein n=1 Tax=Paxillus involutus ATCC 200175 TaxID=664439 RepID=A0A0C9STU2_PAXIN|nr:hypothetical protein PAXINDRAFT_14807 [Paxillus involutus ATCC 200175]
MLAFLKTMGLAKIFRTSNRETHSCDSSSSKSSINLKAIPEIKLTNQALFPSTGSKASKRAAPLHPILVCEQATERAAPSRNFTTQPWSPVAACYRPKPRSGTVELESPREARPRRTHIPRRGRCEVSGRILYIQESTDIGAEDVYGSVRQEVTVDEEQ